MNKEQKQRWLKEAKMHRKADRFLSGEVNYLDNLRYNRGRSINPLSPNNPMTNNY